MAELGEDADAYHGQLAGLAAALGVEVIAVGELARAYETDRWVPDAEAALVAARDTVEPGDAVLVKASRSVGLEGIAPALANLSA
jgi:UDP-N-acetylmuramoyl-tripeptide--D-alanyl-D-alanine ligase